MRQHPLTSRAARARLAAMPVEPVASRPLDLGRGMAGVRGAVFDLAPACVIAFALSVVVLATTDSLTYDHAIFPFPWDHHKYLHMAASGPFGFHIAPYCWRVGVPLLASLLPFGLQTSFMVIAFAGVWSIAVVSYLLARSFGFSRALALTALLFFFALQWGPKFLLYDFWLPDAAVAALITVAIYLAVRRKMLWFALVVALGVTVKESMLFVLPLWYTFNTRALLDWRVLGRTLLLALPALVLVAGIRLAIPPRNDDAQYVATLPERLWLVRAGSTEYGLVDSTRIEMRERVRTFGWGPLQSYTIGTFGPVLTLLPLFAIGRSWRLALRFLPFMILCAAQMLYGHDIERYLILTFPAYVVLALYGLEALGRRLRVHEWLFASLPLVLIGFQLAIDPPFFLQLRYHVLAFVVAAAAIAGLRALVPGLTHGAARAGAVAE